MFLRQWEVKTPPKIPPDLLAEVGENRIVAAYLYERGIISSDELKKYLEPDKNNLSDPFDLPDMQKAVERVLAAIRQKETIGIWGDFDADGQTSTALLVESLTRLEASVKYYLPIRGKESHGLAIPSLSDFLDKGIRLIITCDTGISAHEAINYANERQVDVIVTDHHSLPDELPLALACVNPNRLPTGHPMRTLSGSATAFELILALCKQLDREVVAFDSIDLAALGLIADLAPLEKDVRLIAQIGLKRLSTQPRAWIKSVLTAANIQTNVVDETTIGFTIAPRLNALGRLDDANLIIPFLMDQDPNPGEMAAKLERLNADRRWLSSQVGQSAIDQVSRHSEILQEPVIILSNPVWPGGVLGLAASKLVNEYKRPTILLNESPEGILRGSARSVEGINITEAITSASDLLLSSGGHPMAAGLSLKSDNLPEFHRRICTWLKDKDLAEIQPPPLKIDAEVSVADITPEFFVNIQRLAPFGNSNPPLVFCVRRVKTLSSKSLGRNREHYRFMIEDQAGNSLTAVWWGTNTNQFPEGWFDLAFSLHENHFKGETTLQAEWIDFHAVEDLEIKTLQSQRIQVIDLRGFEFSWNDLPVEILPDCSQVFQEPPALDNNPAVGRTSIKPMENLILASIPPSINILEDIIKAARPTRVILAFSSSFAENPNVMLKHTAGLIRYAVTNREGLASIHELAEAANAREETIFAIIEWLAYSGKISVLAKDNDLLDFTICEKTEDLPKKINAEKTISFLLNETQAFKKYLHRLSFEEISSLINSMAYSKLGEKTHKLTCK
jgi:single-stranded-DNA-specific exonuclease